MKVTILYKIIIDGPSYRTDTMEWEGNLTPAEYRKVQLSKMQHKYEYEELCDADDENDTDNSDVLVLNYEVLQEALPFWCEKVNEEIIGETYNEVSNEIGANSGSYLDVVGCWFQENEEDDEQSDELDDDYEYDDLFEEEDGVEIVLRYYVAFGGGEYTEEMEWRTVLSYDNYELYKAFMEENPDAEKNYDTLQVLFPDWIRREYEKIVRYQTESFLSNVDPEDWNCADDMLDPDWQVTECYNVEISGFSIEE